MLHTILLLALTLSLPEQAAQPASPALIEISEQGALDPDLKDFDRPALLAFWLCGEEDGDQDQAARDARRTKVVMAQADEKERRKCESLLGLTSPARIALVNRSTRPLYVVARAAATGATCGASTSLTLAPDRRVPAAVRDLAACAQGHRVDFLIFDQPLRGREPPPVPPTGGFSFSLERPTYLRPAPFRTTAASPQSQRRPAGAQAEPDCPETYTFTVALDATGVASARYRNPRWPPFIGPSQEVATRIGTRPVPAGKVATDSASEFRRCAFLSFVNRVPDRRFVVTVSGFSEKYRWAFMESPGITVRCAGGKCSASTVVAEAATPGRRFSVASLYQAFVPAADAGGRPRADVVKFSVSFFDDDREPTYTNGYLSLVQFDLLNERASESAWSSAASTDFGSLPDLSEFDPKYTPLEGTRLAAMPRPNDWRMQGKVRLSLKQALGSRASGDFELRLKTGDFGGAEPGVSATKYRLEVYALHGLTFSAGRFAVASPSEAIALSEAGDNAGVRYRWVQLNHIFRRQTRDALPDALDSGTTETDRDHHTTVLQATGLPMGPAAALDLYATYGHRIQALAPPADDPLTTKDTPPGRGRRRFWVLGGEYQHAVGAGMRATGALYLSGFRSQCVLRTCDLRFIDGRGWSMLTTYSWTDFDSSVNGARQGVDWSVQGRFGMGAKENPDTTKRREAYSGETAGFGPDVLFLASLSPALAGRHLFDREEDAPYVAGLGNKIYAGVVVNVPDVGVLGDLLRSSFPLSELGAVSGTVRGHVYWLRRPFNDARYLGSEIDAQLALEAPKGVKTGLTAALFWPGDALKPAGDARLGSRAYVDRFTWSLLGTVTLTIP